MDLHNPESEFRNALIRAARKALDHEVETVPITYPPSPDLGDLASPLCFELAKQLRRAPRELAAAIAEAFEPEGALDRIEVAGAGYLNGFMKRQAVIEQRLRGRPAAAPDPERPKIVVEHTNINPNKAAHIGHLRNAVLGDTLVRFLRRLGNSVEVQNYIDDTGVQVADLVVGFRVLRNEGPAEIRERYAPEALARDGRRFDYIAWDLYAETTQYFQEDAGRLSQRKETLQAMEHGDNETSELAAEIAHRMVGHHLQTMDRIGVRYDLLPRESDILGLRFWDTAFDLLRRSDAIRLIEDGKNAGCWVMDLSGVQEGKGEDQKVIVRSDGTVTYVGKDIAYQLWKFGLLGSDFNYCRYDWSPAKPLYELWSTCTHEGHADAASFGRASTVYNVIDTRQSYLQRVVTQGLIRLGYESQAARSVHYAYEMVALTPAAVEALLPEYTLTEEDRGKAYLEMSGRRGLGVRADDLIDTLIERAASEIRKRNPESDESAVAKLARQIGIGALRYYMLRFSRNRVVAFDLDAALAFEGETGPYLQYSVVRASNILAKVEQRFGKDAVDPAQLVGRVRLDALDESTVGEHWNLCLMLVRVETVLAQAVQSLELSTVAKHAHVLAQAFNSFYHRFQVAGEADEDVRHTRTAVVHLYREGMVDLLQLMGIDVPARM